MRVSAPHLERISLAGAALAAVVFVLAQTRTDVDLWGHVRFGLDILDSGALHDRDPYSCTSDRAWINHEWLAEVAFASAWKFAGTPGLIAVKLACALGALALIAAATRQSRVGNRELVFLGGLTLLGISPYWYNVAIGVVITVAITNSAWQRLRRERAHVHVKVEA